MRTFIGITDSDWFSFLSSEQPDEVNFWQPSGNVPFRVLSPGEPFLFKLHSPDDFVVGGGFFGHFTTLPVSLAWRAFGTKNGAQTEQEMRARLEHYRRISPRPNEDYNLGCILLQSPYFFRREDWIPVSDWSRGIVRGKGYDTTVEPGSLWERIEALLGGQGLEQESAAAEVEQQALFGAPHTVLPRLGQGTFRVIVADAYQRRCAFTRSPVIYMLHTVRNGLLFRADFHELFDRGYITVTPEHKVVVNGKIVAKFDNGKEYYALHGSAILLPAAASLQPAPDYLRWHNEKVFQG